MNALRLSRQHLQMTQVDFGVWLGSELGRNAYSKSEISRYETGRVCPGRHIRQATSWLAAKELSKQVHGLTLAESTEIIAEAME